MVSLSSSWRLQLLAVCAGGMVLLSGSPVSADTFSPPREIAQLIGGLPPPPIGRDRDDDRRDDDRRDYDRDRDRGRGDYDRRDRDRGRSHYGYVSRDSIRSVQSQLRRLGYYYGRVDGIAGSGTRAAIARFQRAYGLIPDGVPGPATLRALKRAVARG